jgi:hypothetical protein
MFLSRSRGCANTYGRNLGKGAGKYPLPPIESPRGADPGLHLKEIDNARQPFARSTQVCTEKTQGR